VSIIFADDESVSINGIIFTQIRIALYPVFFHEAFQWNPYYKTFYCSPVSYYNGECIGEVKVFADGVS